MTLSIDFISILRLVSITSLRHNLAKWSAFLISDENEATLHDRYNKALLSKIVEFSVL